MCVCVYVCDYYHYHFFFNYYCCSPASPQILYNGVRCVILVRLCVCMLLLFFFFFTVFSRVTVSVISAAPYFRYLMGSTYGWPCIHTKKKKRRIR